MFAGPKLHTFVKNSHCKELLCENKLYLCSRLEHKICYRWGLTSQQHKYFLNHILMDFIFLGLYVKVADRDALLLLLRCVPPQKIYFYTQKRKEGLAPFVPKLNFFLFLSISFLKGIFSNYSPC